MVGSKIVFYLLQDGCVYTYSYKQTNKCRYIYIYIYVYHMIYYREPRSELYRKVCFKVGWCKLSITKLSF